MKDKLLDIYNNTQHYIKPHLNSIIVNFIDGARVEILGDYLIEYYIEFIDDDTKEIIHSGIIKNNNWIKASRQWYTNWLIKIKIDNNNFTEYKMNLKDKNVYISFDSKSLGDTLAWIPYVEEFRIKHGCNIFVSTFWNTLFKNQYLELKFVEPNIPIENIYAKYSLGIYEDGFSNLNLNKNDTRKQPLQKIACDLLSLEYKEIKPKIYIKNSLPKIKGKYVCIAEHATAQCKYWNNKSGWQEVVNYLSKAGYKVVIISKEKTELKNIIDKTGEEDIHTRINELSNAEFFIGISSGLSWLAWATNIPVIMISGHTLPWYEFACNRVINDQVCHGCWHDSEFDRGNWYWCPKNKNFECTKKIKSTDVIYEINKITDSIINTDYLFYVPDLINKIDLTYNNNGYNWNYRENYKAYDSMFHEIFNDDCYGYKDVCRIKKNDVVVDIGANIGIFERYAYINGAKKIYCYEPEKNNFNILQKNISNITIAKQYIISDISYSRLLFLDKTIGGHSIYNNNINNTKTGESYLIQSKTLNDIFLEEKLDRINFLKIDAEGAELEIINSITDENLNKIDKIVLEYHDMIFNFNDELKENLVKRLNMLGFNSWVQNITTHLSIMYFWK